MMFTSVNVPEIARTELKQLLNSKIVKHTAMNQRVNKGHISLIIYFLKLISA